MPWTISTEGFPLKKEIWSGSCLEGDSGAVPPSVPSFMFLLEGLSSVALETWSLSLEPPDSSPPLSVGFLLTLLTEKKEVTKGQNKDVCTIINHGRCNQSQLHCYLLKLINWKNWHCSVNAILNILYCMEYVHKDSDTSITKEDKI